MDDPCGHGINGRSFKGDNIHRVMISALTAEIPPGVSE